MANIAITTAGTGTETLEVDGTGRVRRVLASVAAGFTACNDAGDEYENDGQVELLITNTGPDDIEVARLARDQSEVDGRIVPDDVIVAVAGEITIAKALSQQLYNSISNGRVQLRYPAATAAFLSIIALRTARAY